MHVCPPPRHVTPALLGPEEGTRGTKAQQRSLYPQTGGREGQPGDPSPQPSGSRKGWQQSQTCSRVWGERAAGCRAQPISKGKSSRPFPLSLHRTGATPDWASLGRRDSKGPSERPKKTWPGELRDSLVSSMEEQES